MPQLFRLDVTYSAIVLAESPEEAATYARDITDYANLDTRQVTHLPPDSSGKVDLPRGWELDCLVYHRDQRAEDITVRSALKVASTARKIPPPPPPLRFDESDHAPIRTPLRSS